MSTNACMHDFPMHMEEFRCETDAVPSLRTLYLPSTSVSVPSCFVSACNAHMRAQVSVYRWCGESGTCPPRVAAPARACGLYHHTLLGT